MLRRVRMVWHAGRCTISGYDSCICAPPDVWKCFHSLLLTGSNASITKSQHIVFRHQPCIFSGKFCSNGESRSTTSNACLTTVTGTPLIKPSPLPDRNLLLLGLLLLGRGLRERDEVGSTGEVLSLLVLPHQKQSCFAILPSAAAREFSHPEIR